MDLIRFVAASAVIYGHAFHLQDMRDPLEEVTGHSTGSLAVGIFFCLSGFLIAKSLCNRPSLLEFLLARCLRILPALIIINIGVVIVAGFFWTTLSPYSFFTNGRSLSYIFWNSSLLKCQYDLPGVFQENTANSAVNGSLWTLPVEARMYGLVFAAGVMSLMLQRLPGLGAFDRRRVIGSFGLAALLLSGWLWSALSLPFLPGVLNESGVILMGFFGVGMIFQCVREHVRLSGWAVLVVAFLLALIPDSTFRDLVFFVWLAYVCLWFSYTPSIDARKFGKRGDMSYGIYIFAFPVQQWLYSTNEQMAPMTNAILTFVIVLPLAAASFHWLEKPALRLKHPLASKLESFLHRRRVAGDDPVA